MACTKPYSEINHRNQEIEILMALVFSITNVIYNV